MSMPTEAARPRVVYHHRTQGVDAQGIHIHEMCKAFSALGFDVVKVALHAQEQPGAVSRSGLVNRATARLPGWIYEILELGYNLVGIPRLYLAVKIHRPLFIYERYSLSNLSGVVVSKLTGTPLVLEVNSPLAWEKSRYGGLTFKALAQRLETWIVNNASRTITVTGVLKRMLAGQGADSGRIAVMPNGVNIEDYDAMPIAERQNDLGGAGHAVRKTGEGAKGNGAILGFVGWFRQWHGLSEMLEALEGRGIFRQGARLILVGDGPARPELEGFIRQRQLEESITITGPVDRRALLGHLAGMDIALQPAATEYASPMKLFEYLAAGKAVIAPDQENIREVVRHGEHALLFPPGDWAGLAQGVEELMHDPALRLRLGQAGRRAIRENRWTWEGNAARVVEMMAASAHR